MIKSYNIVLIVIFFCSFYVSTLVSFILHIIDFFSRSTLKCIWLHIKLYIMSELFGYSMLQMTIKSICLTLEAGVGHRTMPMLLAKSSFHGDVKNWSTLINLHSELTLEVTDAEPFTVKYRWIMFDFCFCFLCFWYCLVYLLMMMMMIPMIFQNIPACNGQALCVFCL